MKTISKKLLAVIVAFSLIISLFTLSAIIANADGTVVEVGSGKTYETITADALTEASGGTIKLTSDITVATAGETGIKPAIGDLSIDLNGFTLTSANNRFIDTAEYSGDPRNIIIKNGTIKHTGSTVFAFIRANVNFTVEDVDITTGGNGPYGAFSFRESSLKKASALTVKNSKITTTKTGGCGVFCEASGGNIETTISVEGSVITGITGIYGATDGAARACDHMYITETELNVGTASANSWKRLSVVEGSVVSDTKGGTPITNILDGTAINADVAASYTKLFVFLPAGVTTVAPTTAEPTTAAPTTERVTSLKIGDDVFGAEDGEWVSGSYATDGKYTTPHSMRVAYSKIIDVQAGDVYNFTLGAKAGTYKFLIRPLEEDGKTAATISVAQPVNDDVVVYDGCAKLAIGIFDSSQKIGSSTILEAISDGTIVPRMTVKNLANMAQQPTRDPSEVTTTKAPTTKAPTTEAPTTEAPAATKYEGNEGTVYSQYKQYWYGKAEGWHSGAVPCSEIKEYVMVDPNGQTIEIAASDGYNWQQIYTNWSMDGTELVAGKNALTEAVNGSGYLYFDVTVSSATSAKGDVGRVGFRYTNLCGKSIGASDDTMIFFNPGETKRVFVNVSDIVDINTMCQKGFQMYFKNGDDWNVGLNSIKATISPIKVVPSEQTTTVAPTTAEQTTAEQTTAEQTTAEQTTAEETTAEETTAEETTAEETTAEQTTEPEIVIENDPEFPAYNDGGANLYLGNIKGKAGQTVNLPICVINNPGLSCITLSLKYDANKLTPVLDADGNVVTTPGKANIFTDAEFLNGPVTPIDGGIDTVTVTAQRTDMKDSSANGVIAYVKFTLKGDLNEGDTAAVAFADFNSPVINANGEDVTLGYGAGNIEVITDTTKAPTTKAPATKAPDTKAPATKAPVAPTEAPAHDDDDVDTGAAAPVAALILAAGAAFVAFKARKK